MTAETGPAYPGVRLSTIGVIDGEFVWNVLLLHTCCTFLAGSRWRLFDAEQSARESGRACRTAEYQRESKRRCLRDWQTDTSLQELADPLIDSAWTRSLRPKHG